MEVKKAKVFCPNASLGTAIRSHTAGATNRNNYSKGLTFKMSILKIELGAGNLKGSLGFGNKENYTYDVPETAIYVSLHHKDTNFDTLNTEDGNGKVTLRWDKARRKAYIEAWVKAAAGSANEVRWTVYCWIKL